MPLTIDNLKTLVEWLGPEGAEAGLEYGDVTVAELRSLLVEQGVHVSSKVKRKELITDLLYGATKKIHKTLDELLAMSQDELVYYFEEVRPSRKEVMLILAEIRIFTPAAKLKKACTNMPLVKSAKPVCFSG